MAREDCRNKDSHTESKKVEFLERSNREECKIETRRDAGGIDRPPIKEYDYCQIHSFLANWP